MNESMFIQSPDDKPQPNHKLSLIDEQEENKYNPEMDETAFMELDEE